MPTAYREKTKPPRSASFRRVFDKAPTGMALLGLDGRVLRVNRAFCRILCNEEKYFLSREFQGTIFSNSDQDSREIQELIAGTIRYLQREKDYVYEPGHSIRILISVALIREKHGNPLHLIAQIQDIGGYKKLEEEKERLV